MQNAARMHASLRNLLTPAAIALLAAIAVIVLWQSLRRDHETRIANVTEATSYATRSELARRLAEQVDALRALGAAWVTSADGAKAALEIVQFDGTDSIAWSERDGTRFLARAANRELSYVPSNEEWQPIEPYVTSAFAAPTETIVGPEIDRDGHAIFRLLIPVRGTPRRAVLVATIDAHDLLESLLVDEALGYAIRVSCCDGVELYRRGSPARDLPEAWSREGWIAPTRGLLWNVAHSPSSELREDLVTTAADSVLIVGLSLAVLLGGLVFETRRATERANAAYAAEQQIRALNRELEERVVARTQDLSDVLDELNTINLSVSHDLRSPLNAMSLTVGLLREASEAAESSRLYDKIDSSVARMTEILNRLLGYSRASAFESELEAVDMRTLVEQVLREQSIDPRYVRIGALPAARADRTLTHIALGNLLGNAARHGRAGRGLRIEIGSRELADGTTGYFVADNGPGIDAQTADKLFRPIQRDRASRAEGLGLGLAIAARAIERHQGRIWVESEPGRGATFWFTLRAPGGES